MADGSNLKMKLSVEKVIHDSIRETLENLYDDYGIKVNSVNVTWLDLSQVDKTIYGFSKLTVETETSSDPKK